MSHPIDVSEDRLVEYVLGELRRDEAQALENLMQADTQLAAEVRRLRQVFDLLPYAAVTEPPPELRARVLDAAAARTRETAPPAAAPRAPPRSGRARAARRPRLGRRARLRVSSGASPPPRRRRRWPWRSAWTPGARGRS